MVIQADGEKYACDACVRGHRVSSCTHKDRHLNHINKKGRPVSQCQHCRGARKNRASHVKCVCAELGIVRPNVSAQDGATCHCMVGQRCTCAGKRDILVSDSLAKAAAVNVTSHRRNSSKPSMVNRRSDSVVPKHQNGHHPPLHRHNYAAHDYSPYPIKRSATLHGPPHSAQRSVDNLSHDLYSTSPSSLPVPSYMSNAGALTSNSMASASVPAGLSQLGGAPKNSFTATTPALGSSNSRWSINDFSAMSSYPNMSVEQFGSPTDTLSAMSDAQFNWSDWDFDAASAPTQQDGSVASVDHPGLSRSSSGTASDTGDSAFNPANFRYPRLPAPGVPVSGAPSWSMEGNWNAGAAGLQDKTPVGLASKPNTSAAPSNDYFGEYTRGESARYARSRPVDDSLQFNGTTSAAFDGSLPAMAMPNLPSQQGNNWQVGLSADSSRAEDETGSSSAYQTRSWL